MTRYSRIPISNRMALLSTQKVLHPETWSKEDEEAYQDECDLQQEYERELYEERKDEEGVEDDY